MDCRATRTMGRVRRCSHIPCGSCPWPWFTHPHPFHPQPSPARPPACAHTLCWRPAVCAWYVLSSIGVFQVCPGNPIYTIGSPSFRSAALHTDGKPSATIEAPENSADNVYVHFASSSLDGAPLDRSYVTYGELVSGCALRLSMASEPDTRRAEDVRHWAPTE